jgi:sigma-B regulation protein RsbU (phosphoserine phosphatase)
LSASDSPYAKSVARATPQATTAAAAPGAPAPPRLIGRTIEVAGVGPSRASITPFNPYAGARWRVITVLPESAFLAHAHAMQRRSILFAIGAIVGAVAVGIVFSRRLSRPLRALIDHVAKIGGGDFRARLELQGARELAQLANETNRMAAGLRQRMELEKSIELATHVQQSLLPQATPRICGMEISSRTRYCDSTGGDYLDFIDVANLSDDRAFIAVGDVSGHGLGTALLMASARAAVRTSAALGNETLGQLMARVNDVLARDARHGLFMTLLLLILDPVQRKAQWSSAGHDPAIVFDPQTDSFQELEGGDIILGVIESVTYENFTFEGLPPNGVLFIGTDGLWEAHKPDGEMFGKDRVRDIIRANSSRSANEIAAALDESLNKFLESRHPHDDVTFVVVKFVPVAPEPRERSVEVAAAATGQQLS